MPLEVSVVKSLPTGLQFWDALQRIIPRALAPTAARMRAAAPRGKTGKLSRRVEVHVKRISSGFIQGVEADFGVGVPYGHLIEAGHKIIPRGPGRKGAKLGALRTQLKARRAQGSKGFVPGTGFASRAFTADRASTAQALEAALRQEFDRVI